MYSAVTPPVATPGSDGSENAPASMDGSCCRSSPSSCAGRTSSRLGSIAIAGEADVLSPGRPAEAEGVETDGAEAEADGDDVPAPPDPPLGLGDEDPPPPQAARVSAIASGRPSRRMAVVTARDGRSRGAPRPLRRAPGA